MIKYLIYLLNKAFKVARICSKQANFASNLNKSFKLMIIFDQTNKLQIVIIETQEQAKNSEINCSVDSYGVALKLQGEKINVRAFSENLVKLFTGSFSQSDFPEDIRVLGGCPGIFGLVQDSIQQKQTFTLNDVGQLQFSCPINLGKFKLIKEIIFSLQEVEFNEIERMKFKIQKLEKEICSLKLGSLPKKTSFEIDTTSAYFNKFKIEGRVVSLLPGTTSKWYPLFSKNKIQGTQEFVFDLINSDTTKQFMVGIGTENIKNESNPYANNYSIVLYSQSCIYIQNANYAVVWNPTTGNKLIMTVNLQQSTIKWDYDTNSVITRVGKVKISEAARALPFYAYITLYDANNNDKIQLN